MCFRSRIDFENGGPYNVGMGGARLIGGGGGGGSSPSPSRPVTHHYYPVGTRVVRGPQWCVAKHKTQQNSSLVVVSSAIVVRRFVPSSCVRKPSRLLIQKDLRTKTVSRPFLDRYLSVLALLVRLPFRIWRCTHMHERMNAGSGAIRTAAAEGWVLSWSTRVIDGRKSNGITIAA